jgi:acyl carrier protein phosphodiesterase
VAPEPVHHRVRHSSEWRVNYLAHLYLSPPSEDALLGSLLGDFVKGPIEADSASALTRAIALHRKLDVFTDAHPAVVASRERVSAARRRYAGIMIDMFYDHFLAKHWAHYHDEPLEEFSMRVYAMLERRFDELPVRLQQMAPYMIRGDWLGSYAEVESIGRALDRIGTRLRRENRLYGSAEELLENYPAFEADFRLFLPQAMHFSRTHALSR